MSFKYYLNDHFLYAIENYFRDNTLKSFGEFLLYKKKKKKHLDAPEIFFEIVIKNYVLSILKNHSHSLRKILFIVFTEFFFVENFYCTK